MTEPLDGTDAWKFALQDGQYEFPYHFLPHFDEITGAGVSSRSLGWGLEYLCYLRHVAELARSLEPRTLLDVGCGEGRFLDLVGPDVERRVGIDASEAAIRFARAFCPQLEFYTEDTSLESAAFDLVVTIEVLEHIPDQSVPRFISRLSDWTRCNGHLIVVVPTTATRVLAKHHRHYDLPLLEDQLSAAAVPLELERVDYLVPSRPPWLTFLTLKLLLNRWWRLDIYALRAWVWRQVWEKRRVATHSDGRHLVALLRKTR